MTKADPNVAMVPNATPDAAEETAWHSLPNIAEVMEKLETKEEGLTNEEAERRLKIYGPNCLTPPEKPGFFKKLWIQLNNILIWILVAAAIVSGYPVKEYKEVGLIIAVIVINVSIGMIQEGRAEKAAEAIKAMLSSKATAVRNGEKITLEADKLVPGDVVFVQSGDRVPADVRWITVNKLQVQEAMLTGG